MFDKDNGESEVLDETEAVESAGDVAETAATAEAVEDISDAADTQDLSDDLLYYDSAIGRDNMLGGIVILKGSKSAGARRIHALREQRKRETARY